MTTHHFVPDHYFSTMGTHAPVLTIRPGDTVVTDAVDANGWDRHGAQLPHAMGGNPMTGPFYVEGAEPGDTLVVHLDKITPNRVWGWSSARLSPNVVDPMYVWQLPNNPDGSRPRANWDVDAAAGTATLVSPETTLGRYVLPITPMIGCFGVAPADGEAISTATSGTFGGNMDYNGFCEGVTVYFPVHVEGALFFLGDVHATQGDGEMSGTGIEISSDLTFTVGLQKRRTIGWPRGENATHIFAAGNARPLDQCVQHATTEMLKWLQAEYGMDALAANLLMGQTVQYDLGNMYDPAYTMICKMPKSVLPSISHHD
jgi:amidase